MSFRGEGERHAPGDPPFQTLPGTPASGGLLCLRQKRDAGPAPFAHSQKEEPGAPLDKNQAKGDNQAMISRFSDTKEQLARVIRDAFRDAFEEGLLPSAQPAPFVVEVPGDTAHGDFAANAAMVNARAMHMAPRKIAEILIERFQFGELPILKTEIAGPGFINFYLKPEWFSSLLDEVLQKGESFGRSDYGRHEKVMVEFVSANPTGPMHMGNARGGAIGDCLASALEWSGHDVTREFYVNDAGNQINKFGASLEVRYLQHFEGEDKHPLPEDCYQGLDIVDHAEAFAAEYGDRYLTASSEERQKALVDFALPKNIANLERDLGKYRITYDVWFRESRLHDENKVLGICEKLKADGWAYEKEGALWYNNIKMMKKKAEEAGNPLTEEEVAELKDDVLVRANGVPTYFAADIAYHYNKFAERHFDRVINVWGADHHGHVARLKGAMDAVGLDGDKLDIVLMQLVRLMKDGQPYRMSKRSGRAVTLTDLLDDVPIDAARFFFNMREPNATFDFDLDLAVQQSSDNPVYYVQYAHARICSVLKLVAAEGRATVSPLEADKSLLSSPEERELIRKLAQLPDEIVTAAASYDPARLTRYVMDVATLYHKFYQTCRVLSEDEALCSARAALCRATAAVIENTLGMLKISAPEVM